MRAEYQPSEDDTDGPSIEELVVMDDADDDDNDAAAPGVAAGLDTNSDCESTALATGMDDTITSVSAAMGRRD
eukprot:907534-Pleurochrysis_carterae.AAC.1